MLYLLLYVNKWHQRLGWIWLRKLFPRFDRLMKLSLKCSECSRLLQNTFFLKSASLISKVFGSAGMVYQVILSIALLFSERSSVLLNAKTSGKKKNENGLDMLLVNRSLDVLMWKRVYCSKGFHGFKIMFLFALFISGSKPLTWTRGVHVTSKTTKCWNKKSWIV